MSADNINDTCLATPDLDELLETYKVSRVQVDSWLEFEWSEVAYHAYRRGIISCEAQEDDIGAMLMLRLVEHGKFAYFGGHKFAELPEL
jgi:hypothetical protein